MIAPPKLPGTEKQQKTPSSRDPSPRDADAHAMKALLNPDRGRGAGSDLSSLFSTQTRQAAADLKTRGEGGGLPDKALEQRLKQYRDAKELTREEGEQDNSQADHGQGQHPDPEPLDDLAQEVAEHILVSDKAHMDSGKAHEVRIKIKDSILKDAHVRMVRRLDCLEVELISSDEQSVQTLVAARKSLEQQLEQNYKGLIRIRIVHLKPGTDV